MSEENARFGWRRPPLRRPAPAVTRIAVASPWLATAKEIVDLASHELRTPLTSIKSWTDLALRQLAHQQGADVARYLASVSRQVGRMELVIETLLDDARAPSPADLQTSPFDLCQLVTELVADLPEDWGARVRVCRGSPLLVEAHRGRVEQVICNLLTNAIKYSEPSTMVRISMIRSGPFALTFVADRGIGIPPEQLPRVFDRYFRVPGSHSLGLGLGLHVVKQIVEQHRGSVAVRSREGHGSIFRFSLPARDTQL